MRRSIWRYIGVFLRSGFFFGIVYCVIFCIVLLLNLSPAIFHDQLMPNESKIVPLLDPLKGAVLASDGESRKRGPVQSTAQFYPTEEELFAKLRNIDSFVELLQVDLPYCGGIKAYYRLPYATNIAWSREYSRVIHKRIVELGLHDVGYRGFSIEFLTPSMQIDKQYWFSFVHNEDVFDNTLWRFNDSGYNLQMIDKATSIADPPLPPALLSDDNGVFTSASNSSEVKIDIEYLLPGDWWTRYIEASKPSSK